MENVDVAGFLGGLGRLSLQAGVLVLVVLAAQWLWRKQLSPRWRCALWLLVVARLLLPVSFGTAVSIFNLLPHWTNRVEAVRPPAKPAADADRPIAIDAAARALPLIAPSTEEEIPNREPANLPKAQVIVAAPAAAVPAPAIPAHQPLDRRLFSWAGLLFCTWLFGVLVLSGYVVVSSVRLARTFSRLTPLTDPVILKVLADCRSIMNVKTRLTVVESNAVSCPALFGLLRPRLVLPSGFASNFSEREMRFIFLHELAHLKRRDLALNWLVAALQVLHWFNPIVWLGFARWRADRELACDAMALDAAGAEQNTEYGRTILRLLAGFTRGRPEAGLVGILESKHQLLRRIGMIANYVPGRRWQFLALLLAGAIGVIGLTDAQTSLPKKDRPNSLVQTNQPVAERSRPAVTNGATMKVLVLDAESGKPLTGVEVLAPNHASFFGGKENAPRWLTDKEGVALIHLGEVPSNHLAELSWFTLSARHAGYGPRGVSWSAENKDVRPSLPAEITIRLEKGLSVGGIVRDEKGMALAGIGVRVYGSGYWQGLRHEYPEFWTDSTTAPVILTDRQGRWQIGDFPKGLEVANIEIWRPNGAAQPFYAAPDGQPPPNRSAGDPIKLADLRAGQAEFVLKSGIDVSGMVVDPAGKPVPGLLVKSGTGVGNLHRLQEFRTDSAGRFQLQHLPRRQLILTAYPTNFAITTIVVDPGANTSAVHFQLTPFRPLRLRVLNGEGRPIGGAKVTVDAYRTEGQVLDFVGETGPEGTLTWTNAPASAYALVASAPANGRQKVRLTSGRQEVTFRLREGMDREVVITGRLRDAKTGAAVKPDWVGYQDGDRKGFEPVAEILETGFRLRIAATQFRPGGMYPSYQLQVRAKGYSMLVSAWRDFDEGDWDAEFSLEPATESIRTVLLPNGEPAGQAQVWARADNNNGNLFCNGPGRYYGDRLIKLRADAQGHFELPSVPDDQPLVCTHPDGFLDSSLAELKRSPLVRLQPWGRIEGVLKIGGQPKSGVRIGLSNLGPMAKGMNLIYNSAAASDGSFVFTNVPAGEYRIYRQLRTRSGRTITEDHQMPVTVKAGETAKVEYGGGGRQVFGQAMPDNPSLAVDWLNDDHTLTLKQPALSEKAPNPEDFASYKSYEQARDRFSNSPERWKQARDARTYVLEFERDGSFRADDIPAGTYGLRIVVTKPDEKQQFSPFPDPNAALGSLVREIVVPPGKDAFDLGTLFVPIKGDTGLTKLPPVAFAAQTLEGAPFTLDKFKGKYVLLAFWGSWSERSIAKFTELGQLRADFAKDPRITMLGVSIDEEIGAARKAAEAHHFSWEQAWLPPEKVAGVTAAFEVDTLPAVFLLDPDGRIVGRDLEGDRIQAALRRALASK